MQLPVRIAFVVYLVVLTVLLLLPDPHAATGIGPLPPPLNEYGTHFLLMAGLALLAHASRWTVRRGGTFLTLAIYAVAVEALQTLVPPRDVELGDFIENLLGVAVGTAVWWAAARIRAASGQSRLAKSDRNEG